MSEHKYRAWDTQYDQWAYFTLDHLISGDVADIAQRCKDWCRYTGLKDKNGKEIYEGDIVKVLHGEWWSQHLGSDEEKAMTHEQYLDSLTKQYEVVFAIDRFVGKRHIGYSPWETDENGYTYTRLTPDKHGYIEIIGNIYENGDLLK